MNIIFDIGGTSMRVARAIGEGIGEVHRTPTPQGPKEGVAALASLIRECAGSEALEAVVGGFPGVIAEGTIRFAPNLPEWVGYACTDELSQVLGVSVEVRHDADLAALGESWRGAGKGFRVVAYVGVGTGIGCGRVVEGHIDSGLYVFEAGHQIVDVVGGKGLEEMVSGRAFEKRYGVHPKDAPRAAYEEMTPVLAAGLYNTMLHWSPEVFVLGGSMMNEENGYRLREVAAALERLPKIYPRFPELRAATLKDAAGLHGAAALLLLPGARQTP